MHNKAKPSTVNLVDYMEKYFMKIVCLFCGLKVCDRKCKQCDIRNGKLVMVKIWVGCYIPIPIVSAFILPFKNNCCIRFHTSG